MVSLQIATFALKNVPTETAPFLLFQKKRLPAQLKSIMKPLVINGKPARLITGVYFETKGGFMSHGKCF